MPYSDAPEWRQQRYRRANVRLTARISTIDPETDEETGKPYFRTSEELCQNLSRGGAFLLTDETLTPGRRLLVELEIPGGTKVQTIGRVAWAKAQLTTGVREAQAGIGVEFLGGSSEHFSALERYILRLEQWGQPKAAAAAGPAARPIA